MNRRQHTHQHKRSRAKNDGAHHGSTRHSTTASTSDPLFTIDRKGDIQNLRYGSIDKYKVPKYYTSGYGRLLGLDRRFKIVSNSGNERHIEDRSVDWSSKNHVLASSLKLQSEQGSAPLVRADISARDEVSEQQNFVALGRKRRKLENRSTDEEEDNDLVLHRTAEGQHGSRSSSSSNSESAIEEFGHGGRAHDQDSFEAFKNHPDNQKYLQLRTFTDQHPQDLPGWLNLIDHQEKYFLFTSDSGAKALDTSSKRTVTEMKVALYEKAIAAVKDKQAKETLILGLMKEGTKIWDTHRQLKEWEATLSADKSIGLWHQYLNFRQSNVFTFSYEQCLDTYDAAIGATAGLEPHERDYHRAYLLLRLTKFMYETGFAERAIAIWQATLEYNFFQPSNGGPSGLDAFASFWEGEQPRVGEETAKGWKSNMENDVPTREDAPLANLDPQSLFSSWGRSELDRASTDFMPARTLDETVEDDPYRVILYSDIKDYIFDLRSQEAKELIKQAFLKFCNFPPLLSDAERCRPWWMDPFLCDFSDVKIGLLPDTAALFVPADSPLSVWRGSSGRSDQFVSFAVRTLTQLVRNQISDDRLAEYVVAVQLRIQPASASKFARKLLKQRSDNPLLYNAYALIETCNGKTEAADNVWSTALSMAGSLGAQAQHHRLVLWHCWVWELVQQHRYDHALKLLVHIIPHGRIDQAKLQLASEKYEFSAAQRLRAHTYYREHIRNSLTESTTGIGDVTALYALMKYLLSNNDLDEALSVYKSTTSMLNQERTPLVLEQVHQFRARHIDFHVKTSTTGYKPLRLVRILENSVHTFPDNSMFSKLHEQYLLQAGIVDRIRIKDAMADVTPTSIMPFLLAISTELSRPLYSGSTNASIRRSFRNATAVESPARTCPAVWSMWLHWELSLISAGPITDLKQIKNVYLLAVRACPWAKDLYLQAFVEGNLTRMLGERELTQVYRSMLERGLRIRHDISEILDDRME